MCPLEPAFSSGKAGFCVWIATGGSGKSGVRFSSDRQWVAEKSADFPRGEPHAGTKLIDRGVSSGYTSGGGNR